MASLTKQTGTRAGWRLQFRQSGKRRSLWIGKGSKRLAETVKRHVEELARAVDAGVPPDAESHRWANGLDGRLRDTLAGWELIEAGNVRSGTDAGRLLGPMIDAFIAGRVDLRPTTRTNYGQTRRLLVEYFTADKPIRSITAADAERWRRWLSARPMAPASVNKHVSRAKTILADAVADRLLPESPFADQKAGTMANRDRHAFIDAATTAAVLEACPDASWRVVFGLARFAGMRCPSEVCGLTWGDIDWDASKLRIDSEKTGLRFCPIFPELRPILEQAFDAAPEGERYCVGRHHGSPNLATQLQRIIKRAGIKPWPKTFINLRSTRRTELQEVHPSHVCDAWLGHSTKTAELHYLQVTPDHWAAGANQATVKSIEAAGDHSEAAAIGGVAGGVIPADLGQSVDTTDDTTERENHEKTPVSKLLRGVSLTRTRIELVLPP